MGTSYWFFPSLARLKSINLMWFSGLMLQRIFLLRTRADMAAMPTISRRQDSVHYRYSCILLGAGNKTHRVTKIGIFIIEANISNILIGQIFKNQILDRAWQKDKKSACLQIFGACKFYKTCSICHKSFRHHLQLDDFIQVICKYRRERMAFQNAINIHIKFWLSASVTTTIITSYFLKTNLH